jgi:phosphoglycerate dehydrogenase-like enzyme
VRIVYPGNDGGFADLFGADPLYSRLAALGDLSLWTDLPDADEYVRRAAGADVLLLTTHLDDDMLREVARTVRLIAFTGTGASSYLPLPLARELGVTVTNVVRYGDQAVAELALGLMLAAARSIPAGDRAVRAGEWDGWMGPELAGSTLAVVGFGGIGRTVTRMGQALGMDVLVHSVPEDESAIAAAGAVAVPLEEAFARAAVVSLHAPLTAQTRGMVTAEVLDLLAPGSILVNTARGELIERGALAARLARGDITAALDVFDPEPLPEDDPLLDAPHVILTPHLGFRTPGAIRRMAEQAVASVEAYAAGSPINVVS